MVSPTLYMEEVNKKKSLRVSVAIHILILLIALFPILRDDPEQSIDKQFAVAITFENSKSSDSFKGQAAEGEQRRRNETVDRVKTAPVEKVSNNSKSKPIKQPKVQVPTPQIPTAPAESDIFDKESEIEAVENVPEVGLINAQSIEIKVVFPAPFGPNNPNISCDSIDRSRLDTE